MHRRVALAVLLAMTTVHAVRAEDAQEAPLAKQILAADALFVMPVDSYGDVASVGIGALFRYERRVGSKLSLIARGGPLFHDASIDRQSLFMFLVLGGMRMNIDEDRRDGPFFDAAIGVNYVRVAAGAQGVTASDAEPELTLDFGGGVQLGRFQLRGSIFYTPHVGASFGGDAASYLGLTATLGFDFSAR